MACNCNSNSKLPPLPPRKGQICPHAPPPTPNIEEIRPTLEITEMVFLEEFAFPALAVAAEENDVCIWFKEEIAPIAVAEEVKPAAEEVAEKEKPKKEASSDVNGAKSRKRKAN